MRCSKTLAKTELMLKEKCFEELAMTINTNFYLNICLYTTLFHVVLIATSVNKTYCYKILLCPGGHRPGILTCASRTSNSYCSHVKHLPIILLAT